MEVIGTCSQIFKISAYILIIVFQTHFNSVTGDDSDLPTLYEYYTGSGITTGLSDDQTWFKLNNKNITIYSGAFHYFRVPRAYWSDRLRKMRAAGLNTVETYVPWNLHEPESGVYDWGDGDNDLSDFLHMEEFIKTAQQEDLFVIARPGPYICAEWEFGGLPSWILRNTSTVRSSKDANYMNYVERYFKVLLPKLASLQFTKGGPIIMFQIENEYGGTANIDKTYLANLKEQFDNNGIVELLVTSDSPILGLLGGTDGALRTANFGTLPKINLAILNLFQRGKPSMVMEFWTGWYDHVSEDHHTTDNTKFKQMIEEILDFPASVNLYMFVGGTNWGFMNGVNTWSLGSSNLGFQPDTTSYDYDAPLAENGDYTEKWTIVKEVIGKRNNILTKIPAAPTLQERIAYPSIEIQEQLLLSELIENFKNKVSSKDVIPMEKLSINENSGQSYGSVVYRKTNLNIPPKATLKIKGYVRDTVIVLVNGELVNKPLNVSTDLNGFGYWKAKDSEIILSQTELKRATLDIVVQNMGRVNFGLLSQFRQWKGLTEAVYLNNVQIDNWEIVPLEFKKSWTTTLTGWHEVKNKISTPALYKASLDIPGTPQDTYINMETWTQGIVIVNGFVLGRHILLGPQQALYLPATLLVQGTNDIIIFEHFNAPDSVTFSKDPIWGVRYLNPNTYSTTVTGGTEWTSTTVGSTTISHAISVTYNILTVLLTFLFNFFV